jgi:hypothetical protein
VRWFPGLRRKHVIFEIGAAPTFEAVQNFVAAAYEGAPQLDEFDLELTQCALVRLIAHC